MNRVTSTTVSRLGALASLLYATTGCFGAVQTEAPPGGGGTGERNPDAGAWATSSQGDTGTDAADAASADTGAQPTVLQAEQAGPAVLIISSGDVDEDGAIAADDVNVYWSVLNAQGVYALMSCPVSGCGGSPTTVWTGVNAGSVPGELVAAAGRIYFQTDDGALVDCPSSGCGGAPTPFAPTTQTSTESASLAADSQNLYWQAAGSLYSCALGATCASPHEVARLGPGAVVEQIVPDGATLYWVDSGNGQLGSAGLSSGSGGATNVVCAIPAVTTGLIGQGSFAIAGGYAYVSSGVQPPGIGGGVYRCALGAGAGGDATLFASDPTAIYVESDGESLFWLSGDPTAMTELKNCAPAATCSGATSFLGPTQHMEGFTLAGGFVYSVSSDVQRTAKM